MNELERIIALANHGIIRTPEAKSTKSTKSTTRILKEATGVCKDCGCQIDNCKPGCECKHDSHDASGDHWVAEGSVQTEAPEMVPSTVTGYIEITEYWKEHTLGLGKSDDEVKHEIAEWMWEELNPSGTEERDELTRRAWAIVDNAVKNEKHEITFDDMINQMNGTSEVDEAEVTTEDESVARIRKLANVFSSSTEQPAVETVEQNEDKGNE
jgi:hypothetical protein